ncbi:MAG TPA: chemotaxis protein CheD [Gemmatimonadaceae bacterium]|nr:chemotaxis protein CheD [Gemmatimonadaceae bacterium]
MSAVLSPSFASLTIPPERLTDPRLRVLRTPVYVHPGQVYVSTEAGECATILGSCVAVCLHDPVTRVGGLNHYLLPFPGEDAEPSPRYATTAIDALLHRMMLDGARPHRLVAHVVGGAAVLAAFGADENHLGKRNVQAAYDLLQERAIHVTSSDVGGTRGRKVLFEPRTGRLTVTPIGVRTVAP